MKKITFPIYYLIYLILAVGFLFAFFSNNNEYKLYVLFLSLITLFFTKVINYTKLPIPFYVLTFVLLALHFMGGMVQYEGSILYEYYVIPDLLRYDQLVHLIGTGISTYFGFLLLVFTRKENHLKHSVLFIIVFFFGMGAGALNELIEFIAQMNLEHTYVGGYQNTGYDLVFNTIGAFLVTSILMIKHIFIEKRKLILTTK